MYLARSLLFFRRHLEARTAGCHSPDRCAAPSCNYHISATASHIGLCALSKNHHLSVRMAAYPLLMCLPLQVQHPLTPMARSLMLILQIAETAGHLSRRAQQPNNPCTRGRSRIPLSPTSRGMRLYRSEQRISQPTQLKHATARKKLHMIIKRCKRH